MHPLQDFDPPRTRVEELVLRNKLRKARPRGLLPGNARLKVMGYKFLTREHFLKALFKRLREAPETSE